MRIDHSDVPFKHEDDTVMEGGVSPFGDSLPDQSYFMDEDHLFLTYQPIPEQFWAANHGVNQQFGFAPSPEQDLADPCLSPFGVPYDEVIDISSDDTVNAFMTEDTEDVDASGEDQDYQSQNDDEDSPGPSAKAGPTLEKPPKPTRRCVKRFANASPVNISDSVRDLLIDAEIKGDEHRVRLIAAQVPVVSYDMAKRIKDRIQRIQCRVTTGNTAGSKHRVQYDASNDETYPATVEGERRYQMQIAEAIRDWDRYFEQKPPLRDKSVLERQKKVLGRHLWHLSVEVLSWELAFCKQIVKSLMAAGDGWVRRIANSPEAELQHKCQNRIVNARKNERLRKATIHEAETKQEETCEASEYSPN